MRLQQKNYKAYKKKKIKKKRLLTYLFSYIFNNTFDKSTLFLFISFYNHSFRFFQIRKLFNYFKSKV